MSHREYKVSGAGLGLRRALLGPLHDHGPLPVDFMEVAPENWIGVGGKLGRQFRWFTERHPFICHGLSLSLGGPAPLDEQFLLDLKAFMKEHQIRCYSEHLSYCSDDGHLYDLMPIPFTDEAVHYVADRIKRVQEILEQRIAVENVSYYAAPSQEMKEIEFLGAVLDEADCDLLLDVNNIYVNSVNHSYDAVEFLKALPGERVAYFHVAGHMNEAEDLIIDTHGAAIIENVWDLLNMAYEHFGVVPTLLERDFNFPPVEELLAEVGRVADLQRYWLDASQKQMAHGG
jgi:uncharacterized protein (UPF0276 family)